MERRFSTLTMTYSTLRARLPVKKEGRVAFVSHSLSFLSFLRQPCHDHSELFAIVFLCRGPRGTTPGVLGLKVEHTSSCFQVHGRDQLTAAPHSLAPTGSHGAEHSAGATTCNLKMLWF